MLFSFFRRTTGRFCYDRVTKTEFSIVGNPPYQLFSQCYLTYFSYLLPSDLQNTSDTTFHELSIRHSRYHSPICINIPPPISQHHLPISYEFLTSHSRHFPSIPIDPPLPIRQHHPIVCRENLSNISRYPPYLCPRKRTRHWSQPPAHQTRNFHDAHCLSVGSAHSLSKQVRTSLGGHGSSIGHGV